MGPGRLTVTPFSPVVDGEVLPRAPWRALLSGAARDVDLLTGHNKDEYRLFIAMGGRLGNITDEEATGPRAFAPAPDGPAGYRKAYPDADPNGVYELVFSDWLFRMPTLHLAQAHAASGGTDVPVRADRPGPGRPLRRLPRAGRAARLRRDARGIGAMLTGPTARGFRRTRRPDAPRMARLRRPAATRAGPPTGPSTARPASTTSSPTCSLPGRDVHAPLGAPPVRRPRPLA